MTYGQSSYFGNSCCMSIIYNAYWFKTFLLSFTFELQTIFCLRILYIYFFQSKRPSRATFHLHKLPSFLTGCSHLPKENHYCQKEQTKNNQLRDLFFCYFLFLRKNNQSQQPCQKWTNLIFNFALIELVTGANKKLKNLIF